MQDPPPPDRPPARHWLRLLLIVLFGLAGGLAGSQLPILVSAPPWALVEDLKPNTSVTIVDRGRSALPDDPAVLPGWQQLLIMESPWQIARRRVSPLVVFAAGALGVLAGWLLAALVWPRVSRSGIDRGLRRWATGRRPLGHLLLIAFAAAAGGYLGIVFVPLFVQSLAARIATGGTAGWLLVVLLLRLSRLVRPTRVSSETP